MSPVFIMLLRIVFITLYIVFTMVDVLCFPFHVLISAACHTNVLAQYQCVGYVTRVANVTTNID